jgi:hypothetical protein
MNSPAIEYALRGLERCWLPKHGRWSHVYYLDGRDNPNHSIANSDVFYTLNVLLGMARVQHVPPSVQISEIYYQNARDLTILPVPKYAFGMALWAAAELGLEVPRELVDHIQTVLSTAKNWNAFRAQDIGMILTGATLQNKLGCKSWAPIADRLFSAILEHYYWPSGLFSDGVAGFRRQFASFASQVYLTIACYTYAEVTGNTQALKLAKDCTKKLIELQGPNGEWPWFFDASKGMVVDFYEVYSVHQYGMAPAFLEFAERHGVHGGRDSLIRGFNWIFGSNQLNRPMLVPHLSLSIRSQVRKGELQTAGWRGMRAVRNSYLHHAAALIDSSNIELRRECRSYELGWLLWSFGNRSDLRELTHHTMFVEQKDTVHNT